MSGSVFSARQQELRHQAQASGLLEPYPLDPVVPPSPAIPSGFSAAFLAHLESVGKPDAAVSVSASSEVGCESPENPRSADSSLRSWQPVTADTTPPAVCVVKRFRASSVATHAHVDQAQPLLQACPKVHAARSRSPTQPLGKRDPSTLQLPPDRVDHRHRLGLGTRLSLGPFNPLPAPALSPRTNSRLLSPPPPACVGPALPKPKHLSK